MKTFSESQVTEMLRGQVDQHGLAHVAAGADVSVSFVSAVATGRKPISPKLLDHLGLERVPARPIYRRKATK